MFFQIIIAAVSFCCGCVFSIVMSVLSWMSYRVLKTIVTAVIILLKAIPSLIKTGCQVITDIFDVMSCLQILIAQGNHSFFQAASYIPYFYRSRMQSQLGRSSRVLAQGLALLNNNLQNDQNITVITASREYPALKCYQEEVLFDFNQRAHSSEQTLLLVSKICQLRLTFGYWFVNRELLLAISRVEPSEVTSFVEAVERLARFDNKSSQYENLFEQRPVETHTERRVLFHERVNEIIKEAAGPESHLISTQQDHNTNHEMRL